MDPVIEGEGALVIVPTYEEGENIEALLREIASRVPRAHVLVVDDSSPDGTADLVEAMARQRDAVHLMRRPSKRGLGSAYLAGFRWGLEQGYCFLIQMDADFSHDPRYLPRLLEAARDHDLVIGSRYVEGGSTRDWGLARRLLSRGGSLYSRMVLGVSIKDLTGGFKCFRRETLEEIDLDGIECMGFGFQVELNYEVARRGLRIEELPIVFVDRDRGTSKMNFRIFFEALVRVWKLRLTRPRR